AILSSCASSSSFTNEFNLNVVVTTIPPLDDFKIFLSWYVCFVSSTETGSYAAYALKFSLVRLSSSLRSTRNTTLSNPPRVDKNKAVLKLVIVFPDPVVCQTKPPCEIFSSLSQPKIG